MKEQNANVIITGIKCDNPNCNFCDPTVSYEQYPEWINKSCPDCGENLLTEFDYEYTKFIMEMAKKVNANHNVSIGEPSKKATLDVQLHGNNTVDMTLTTNLDDYDK